MQEVLIGLVSGIVSGTGMGGGTVLILLLTLIMGIDQHIAQATNLIFFIPTSISAIIANWKYKLVDKKIALWVSIAGTIGAVGNNCIGVTGVCWNVQIASFKICNRTL